MKEKSFLQQQAYDTIKSSILSGEMEPNRLYSETKLSAQIGISRTPVREALQCLSQDGYITVIPSKGFMIRQLNDKDMKDSIEIRCAIEGFCTNMVASQIDTEKGRQLLHSLEQTLSDMEESLENGVQLEHFIDSDHQFHLLLVGYMENDEFNQIFQRLLYLDPAHVSGCPGCGRPYSGNDGRTPKLSARSSERRRFQSIPAYDGASADAA